ncbi:hypothetical protein AAHH80_35845, partial [Burkholderia pseudomallei]
ALLTREWFVVLLGLTYDQILCRGYGVEVVVMACALFDQTLVGEAGVVVAVLFLVVSVLLFVSVKRG